MLIKVGIAILVLYLFGPMIGDILVFIQDIIFGLLAWIVTLPLRAVLLVIVIVLLIKLWERIS